MVFQPMVSKNEMFNPGKFLFMEDNWVWVGWIGHRETRNVS